MIAPRLSVLIFFVLICFSPVLPADDGTLLASFDFSTGYGIALMANDVNDDLLLLYIGCHYDADKEPDAYSLNIVPLTRGGDGAYSPEATQTVFTTERQLNELGWAWDSRSRRFAIALLNGETYGDPRSMVVVILDPTGKRVGQARELTMPGLQLNYPAICVVPAKMTQAPANARFLFVCRGWNATTKESGIAAQFIQGTGAASGSWFWSKKETSDPDGAQSHMPYALVPTGDAKGFMLACEWSQHSTNPFLPAAVSLNAKGLFQKQLVLSNEEHSFNSLALQSLAKRKLAVAWVDDADNRFWCSTVTSNLKNATTPRLLSDLPDCTGDFDLPHELFCAPAAGKPVSIFFVGDRSDQSVYQATMKKTGVISNHREVEAWSDVGQEVQYPFYRWFAVAPIAGTTDLYCAVVFQGDQLEVRGYTIPGQ